MTPSGRNYVLTHGDFRATVVEVGGGLRTLSFGDRELLDGYAEDAICPSARGQVLIPWPNRIKEGRYTFAGEERLLPIDEHRDGTAIHGLVRWRSWDAVEQTDDGVLMEHILYPTPGYPFELRLSVRYSLDERGLTVETHAENIGSGPCPFGAGHHPYLFPRDGGLIDDAVVRLPAGALLEPQRLGGTVLDTTLSGLVRDADGLVRARIDDLELWADDAWPYLQVFTGDPLPDVARRSFAVEPMTCPPNAFQTGESLLRLEPGETFRGRWGITM